MRIVFEGTVWTSYAQLFLTTGGLDSPMPDEAFVGHHNGLAGSAVGGSLFLITGTHTGAIPVRVVVDDSEPEPGDWEDIVEVGLVPVAAEAFLSGWASDPTARFELDASGYRARWSASGMDAAHDLVADDSHPALDSYELALWPAPASPDAIVRRTSAHADYWHDHGFYRG